MGMMVRHRAPAVAGSFYPASAPRLWEMLDNFFLPPHSPPAENRPPLRALVAPHAGYVYSGRVAAEAYREVPDWSGVPRIHLWGPAHRVGFRGLAATLQEVWDTPLGSLICDLETVKELISRGHVTQREDAHREEHSLEVQLPFLQHQGFRGSILPLLFGECDPLQVSLDLEPILSPGDLVVVSTDLSHFHPYADARKRDMSLLEALEKGDQQAATQGESCGSRPLLTLMHLANHLNWVPKVLDYKNSGDTSGDRARVVGYAALCYREAPP